MVRRAILLVALPAVLFTGCGSDETGTRPAPAREAATPVQPSTIVSSDGRLGGALLVTPDETLRLGKPGPLPARGAPPRGAREGVDGETACPGADAEPTAATLGAAASATICLLNQERTSRGLVAVTPEERLAAAALIHTRAMIEQKFFAHDGLDGSHMQDRVEATGYTRGTSWWALGENLAWGSAFLSTPASIVKAWMNSAGHRENVLNPEFREIGISILFGTPKTGIDAGATYTTEYGAAERGGDPNTGQPAAEVAAAAKAKPKAKAKKKKAKKKKKARRARVARKSRTRATRRR